MLTGVGLILFMWSHMILVASINLGPGAMNALARFLEDTYLAQTGGPLIGAFLLHFILAARKLPFRSSGTKGHLAAQPKTPSSGYLVMGRSGRDGHDCSDHGLHSYLDDPYQSSDYGG